MVFICRTGGITDYSVVVEKLQSKLPEGTRVFGVQVMLGTDDMFTTVKFSTAGRGVFGLRPLEMVRVFTARVANGDTESIDRRKESLTKSQSDTES